MSASAHHFLNRSTRNHDQQEPVDEFRCIGNMRDIRSELFPVIVCIPAIDDLRRCTAGDAAPSRSNHRAAHYRFYASLNCNRLAARLMFIYLEYGNDSRQMGGLFVE